MAEMTPGAWFLTQSLACKTLSENMDKSEEVRHLYKEMAKAYEEISVQATIINSLSDELMSALKKANTHA